MRRSVGPWRRWPGGAGGHSGGRAGNKRTAAGEGLVSCPRRGALPRPVSARPGVPKVTDSPSLGHQSERHLPVPNGPGGCSRMALSPLAPAHRRGAPSNRFNRPTFRLFGLLGQISVPHTLRCTGIDSTGAIWHRVHADFRCMSPQEDPPVRTSPFRDPPVCSDRHCGRSSVAHQPRADPRVTLLVYEGSNPYDYVAVRGNRDRHSGGRHRPHRSRPRLIEAWPPVSAPAPG